MKNDYIAISCYKKHQAKQNWDTKMNVWKYITSPYLVLLQNKLNVRVHCRNVKSLLAFGMWLTWALILRGMSTKAPTSVQAVQSPPGAGTVIHALLSAVTTSWPSQCNTGCAQTEKRGNWQNPPMQVTSFMWRQWGNFLPGQLEKIS